MYDAFGLSQQGADWMVDKAGNMESKFLLNFHPNLRAECITKGKRQDSQWTILLRPPRILKGHLNWLNSKKDLPDKRQLSGFISLSLFRE